LGKLYEALLNSYVGLQYDLYNEQLQVKRRCNNRKKSCKGIRFSFHQKKLRIRKNTFTILTMHDLFNQPAERHYNNAASAAMETPTNQRRWNNQCKRLYDALMTGKGISNKGAQAYLEYHIGDLNRRVKDLRDGYHIPVKFRVIEGGYHEFYLEETYIKAHAH